MSKPIGNKYRPVTQDILLRDTIVMALPAGGTGSATYNVPLGRGDVRAIEFAVDNSTLANLVLANFSLQGNKKSLINNENLVTYSPTYANRWAPFMCDLPEKSQVTITGANTSGVAINVIFTFLYYDPFIMSLAPIDKED